MRKIIFAAFLLCLLPPWAAFAAGQSTKIEKEDVLLITVYDEPDLETKTRVNSLGEITFPLLGNIKVDGLSVTQLNSLLEEQLQKDYLVNPHVNVFIDSYTPRQVFVMGAVEKPGAYELPREKKTTLLEMISMAGGFTKSAAVNGTKIMRKDKETGKDLIIKVKVSSITDGNKNADVEVLRDDVIVVPDSFF